MGDGKLCSQCYQPYGLVLKKYTASLDKADTDPRALAWVALCYLLAAHRVNLVRTITAAIVGFTETQNSWEVCRQRAMELATKAMRMLTSDSEGQVFVKELFARAEKITASPPREIPIQKYASVWGDSILDIEYEAVMRSGVSIDELNNFVASVPGHQWLISAHP
ncbi:hypothetical protein ACFLYZ_01005 [Thermodesulfobacteriota bacterium]